MGFFDFLKGAQKETGISKEIITAKGEDGLEPICPHCKKELEQIPQRKKRCPFCKNYIHVRTLPQNRTKVLVTEEEAKKIDLEWEKDNFKNKWIENLKQYGITERDIDISRNQLSKIYGYEANDRDVIWSIFNELVARNKDFHDLGMIYFYMALFLKEEGMDFFSILQESVKMSLIILKCEGRRNKVRIITAKNTCKACQLLKDKVFTIDEALDKMPIPCKECTFDSDEKQNGWCRCSYVPIID